jgi:hypothetical protein
MIEWQTATREERRDSIEGKCGVVKRVLLIRAFWSHRGSKGLLRR